ncbi:phosphate ABC transporter permease PstA [Halostagnicola kamekurae]|uniref:Phosphate transport system permease protein PstA n=1 Tax=Halostagnicola kamekurae TaxID=619731 RepID=A0A1I6U343_9EURY|nr:phosphate ABC transporter permease PstA [Halostagnicola kamekurae]SFS95794.1 phosphate ABC transporter membrane protein 2, PhoT family [Halostagnicola kamekurae]
MSGAHEFRLVNDRSTTYEQFAQSIVAGALAAFVLAAGALFGWVSIDGSVGGFSVASYVGGVVFALGIATGAIGALSRWGGIRTTPDRSPGLGVGLIQTGLWMTTAGLFASKTIGLGRIGWLVAVPIGLFVGYLTIGTREDIGATFPAAAFLCLVGIVVLSGMITPTWTWEPDAFDAIVPGTVVIPLLTMFASLLAGWAGASASNRFGTRGRQNGAFLLISLFVLLVLSVLVYLFVFVFERGIMVVLENLAIGGGSILLLTGTALVLGVKSANIRPTLADGTDKIVAFVNLAVMILLGLICAGLIYTIGVGEPISGYSVTIEPTAVVGGVPGLIVGTIFLTIHRRAYADWQPETDLERRFDASVRLAIGALIGTALVEVITQSELAFAGIAVVPTLVILVGGVGLGLFVLRGLADQTESNIVPAGIPPLFRLGDVLLWAFVIGCLHVAVTGYPLGVGPIDVITSGTIDWPFVMNPSQGLGIQKGVMPAMLGTVWIVLGAVTFAVPLAVGAAVFLTEYATDSLFTSAVDVATNGLWSTPSIVFGLFGLAFLVPRFGGNTSIFAAQLVLGFMLLPLVLITSREAMKSVPDEYRDASAALGVSKWETIKSVVIPAAMPGVVTGAILGVGRIAGETAPLLLVLKGPNFPTSSPGIFSSFTFTVGLEPPFVHVSNPALLERASALPYQLYAVIKAGVGGSEAFGWGTTLVLLGVVLSFFGMGIATRRYFRKKLHQ